MLDWSPCFASGKVHFADGRTGTWAVQQYRAGTLDLDGTTIYLYCANCKAKPFM